MAATMAVRGPRKAARAPLVNGTLLSTSCRNRRVSASTLLHSRMRSRTASRDALVGSGLAAARTRSRNSLLLAAAAKRANSRGCTTAR